MSKAALELISADEARRRLLEAARALVTPREEVALEAAAGRVLAAQVLASEPMPSFPRSAMDGFAVRAVDLASVAESGSVSLSLVGSVEIGQRPMLAVRAGEAMAIPTGGYLPDGADAVVMIEDTAPAGPSRIAVKRAVAPGKNVAARGEDFPAGAPVLMAGRRITPADLGALAAFGVVPVPVHARPRVAVLSTGNEICSPGESPAPGQVRDMNQHVLGAGAVTAGAVVTYAGNVPDDPGAQEARLRTLLATHDVVVLSGGSSIGGRDHAAEVFARLGPPGVLFHGMHVRPGKPTLVAQAGHTLLVGMPGVPTSSLVIFAMFIAPALRVMGGERAVALARTRARLTSALPSAIGREDYVRVRLVERVGELWADPLPGGSGSFSSTLAADGLVVIDAATEAVAGVTLVDVVLLR